YPLVTGVQTCALPILHIVDGQRDHPEHFAQMVDAVKAAGYKYALLLGMGGSSLAPEVWKKTFGKIDGFPELLVLDSTVPAQVKRSEERRVGKEGRSRG